MAEVLNILVVAREDEDVSMLSALLRRSSTYQVELARERTVKSGVHRMTEDAFDVVLVELTFEGDRTLDVLRRFVEPFPNIPVLVLAETTSRERMEAVIRAGAQDLLCWSRLAMETLERHIALALARVQATSDSNRLAEVVARSRSDWLSNFSYELRSPMSCLVGAVDLLNETNLDEHQERCAQMLSSACRSLESLLEGVPGASSLSAADVELDAVPFRALEVVQSVVDSIQGEADARDVELTFYADRELGDLVVGDSLRLQQILRNLVGSAVALTRGGTVHVSARGSFPDEDHVSMDFCIQDTGSGISEEDIRDVFGEGPNRPDDLARRAGGLGLGLSVSQALARMMSSRIHVVSRVGLGTTYRFMVVFPRDEEFGTVMGRSQDERDNRVPRVMVVDDAEDNRELMLMFLAGQHVEVDTAADGSEAIELFRSRAYDLVLMDLRMPVMDGNAAIREIRNIERTRGAKPTALVALTASTDPQELQVSRSAGCDDVMTKPIRMREMIDVVQRWTGGSSNRPPEG